MVRAAVVAIALVAAVAPAAEAAEIPPSGTLDLAVFADQRLTGEQGGGRLGTAVAPAGDVNGDGIDDVIVGAPRRDAGAKRNAGAAWVVFGSGDRDPASGPVPGGAGLPHRRRCGVRHGRRRRRRRSATSTATGSTTCWSARRWPTRARPRTPAPPTSCWDGPAPRRSTSRAALRSSSPGRPAATSSGRALAALPDANGDGRDELVVGVPRADRPTARGRPGVRHRGADPDERGRGPRRLHARRSRRPRGSSAGALGANGYRIVGARGRAGTSVAALPDWNGDGRAEIAVGAPSYRRVQVDRWPRVRRVGPRDERRRRPLRARPAGHPARRRRQAARRRRRRRRWATSAATPRGDLAVGADHAGRRSRNGAGRVHVVYARIGRGRASSWASSATAACGSTASAPVTAPASPSARPAT